MSKHREFQSKLTPLKKTDKPYTLNINKIMCEEEIDNRDGEADNETGHVNAP